MAVLIRLLVAASLALGLSAGPALAVFGGKTVGSGDLVAKTLAAVLDRSSTGAHLCTAVALGPRLMLTAAHCTDGGTGGVQVIFATTLTDVSLERVRKVTAIQRAKPTPQAKGSFAYNNPDDVALIVLDSPVPPGTAFAKLADGDGVGAVHIAGYGATSDLRNAGFGKSQVGFDRTLRTARTTLIAKGAVLTADQSRGSGVCTGDSGGPAFTMAGKSLAVAGILIGVSAPKSVNDYCRGSAHYVSVDRWRSWIVSTAKALGQPLN